MELTQWKQDSIGGCRNLGRKITESEWEASDTVGLHAGDGDTKEPLLGLLGLVMASSCAQQAAGILGLEPG